MVEWFAYGSITKMNVLELFPNPIYVESFKEKDNIKNIVYSLLNNTNLEKNSYSDNLFHLGNDSKSSILYDDIFDSFREWIVNHSIFFIKDVMGYKIEDSVLITDSWINISKKGAFQHPHYHTNSFISGTYYVSLKENSSPLKFNYHDISPYTQRQSLILEKEKITKYNSDVIIDVKEGDLLLWSSHLTHGFSNNNSDERISISFNIMPTYMKTGTYGFKVSLL